MLEMLCYILAILNLKLLAKFIHLSFFLYSLLGWALSFIQWVPYISYDKYTMIDICIIQMLLFVLVTV